MNNKKRINILRRIYYKYNLNLAPKIHLNSSSPFELLISVMLSAKATDISVNKAINKLYPLANTPKKMLELGIERIKFIINNVGLFNKKAEYIIKISRILLEKYDGKVPEHREALESLPGVGRKTANLVLNSVFGWPTIAVDTHIFRVCNRTKFASGENVKKVEKRLLNLVPFKFKIHFHDHFIMHGRYTCKARKPSCRSCIINDLCEFEEKSSS